MADNRVKLIIELEKGGATASLKNFQGDVIKSGVAVKDLRNELGNFVVHSKKMANSVKLTQKELQSLEKTVGGFRSATGGATAAAMELGRVVSDAPYGIRGMANNVSQLASQITYMASATDQVTGKVVGFGGAIKGVGRALMGTTGILFLIQGVIAAIDYFANRVDDAKEASDSFSVSVKELNDILEKNSVSQEKVNGKIREYLVLQSMKGRMSAKQKERLDEISDLENKINEQLKVQDRQRKLIEKYRSEGNEKAAKFFEKQIKDNRVINAHRERQVELLKQSQVEFKKYTDAFKAFEGEKKKSSKLKLIEEPELDELKNINNKYQQQLEQAEYQLQLLLADSEEEKLLIKQEYEMKKLARDKEAALESYRIKASQYRAELTLFLDQQVKMGKLTQSEADQRLFGFRDLEAKNLDAIGRIFDSKGEIILQKYDEFYRKLEAKREDFDTTGGEGGGYGSGGDTPAGMPTLEKVAAYIDAYKTLMNGVNDFINGEYERQLTIEQNKTNALNEELNNRLLNENLSKDERAKIQQEIWQNDENLRKKQNEIKKKQFNNQKAFNIANAVIDTYAGATKALATLPPPASFAVASATIASGLLQVANIARQKFQPEAASTPIRTASAGGGGGGVGDRSFNFNLVGASQQNQLAQAIQGTFDKPIKAYVVSKDITNQQQLDANTKSTARFGG